MSGPRLTVVAPGKLVLAGEYAVLDGAPALVLAVDRGVRCEIWSGSGIETPDGDTRFVAPALKGAPRALYVFRDHNPVDLPGKPGFGGSAAACVAACIAAGRPATEAYAIHRGVQGGGSGIDVAASIHGGMLRFQTGAEPVPLQPVVPSVVWSGASARTGPRVQRYGAWNGRDEFVRRSAELVEAFVDDPVAAAGASCEILIAMARDAGLPYLTPGLERVVELARRHGGAAKPSGAGGGDCAVAFFADPQCRSSFEAACAAEGLSPIAVLAAGPAAVAGTDLSG